MSDEWLLIKRGLYYRSNDCGYTGIRDLAGRYSAEEARSRLSPGISMVTLESAPEFSEACFDDLARQHLAKQRDEARAEIDDVRKAFAFVVAQRDHWHRLVPISDRVKYPFKDEQAAQNNKGETP